MIDLLGAVVADPDRGDPPLLAGADHELPEPAGLIRRVRRSVDQPEVEVVGLQLPQTAGEGLLLVADAPGRDLGGQENLLPVEPGIPQGLADPGLVAVAVSGVDVPVAALDRCAHGGGHVVTSDVPRAEPDDRQLVPAADVDGHLLGHQARPHNLGQCPPASTARAAREHSGCTS